MGFSLRRVNYSLIIPGNKIIFILEFNSSSRKIVGSITVIPTQMAENHTRMTVKNSLF